MDGALLARSRGCPRDWTSTLARGAATQPRSANRSSGAAGDGSRVAPPAPANRAALCVALGAAGSSSAEPADGRRRGCAVCPRAGADVRRIAPGCGDRAAARPARCVVCGARCAMARRPRQRGENRSGCTHRVRRQCPVTRGGARRADRSRRRRVCSSLARIGADARSDRRPLCLPSLPPRRQ